MSSGCLYLTESILSTLFVLSAHRYHQSTVSTNYASVYWLWMIESDNCQLSYTLSSMALKGQWQQELNPFFDIYMTVCLFLFHPFTLAKKKLKWSGAVNIRGSALPSAAKSKEESLSVRGVCLCVELSRRCGRSAFNLYVHLMYIWWLYFRESVAYNLNGQFLTNSLRNMIYSLSQDSNEYYSPG